MEIRFGLLKQQGAELVGAFIEGFELAIDR